MDGAPVWPQPIRVLSVDDDDGDRKQVRRVLGKAMPRADITEATSVEQAVRECEDGQFDCAIVDYRMPRDNGLQGVSKMRAKWPYMAIVMLTGQGDELVAVDSIKRGATDYLSKDNWASLPQVIDSAVSKMRLQFRIDRQREDLEMFSALLAHDLMAPTRSIQGFGRFIQDGLRDGDLEKAKENCDLMIAAARRMDHLIKTLHAYTGATTEPTKVRLSMADVLGEVLQNLQAELANVDAKVTSDPLPDLIGNASQLIQLLQNIISNSLKYRSAEPVEVHVSARLQDEFWHITVEDNGVGISEDDALRMFEPLVRLKQAQGIEGMGLGLATCRRIVARHGGEISAAPRASGGTVIAFTLPAEAREAHWKPAAPAQHV